MGIKTDPHRPCSPDVAPCDFWLFPKLTGCRYETIEEMKKAVTKVIDTLTQEDFHGAHVVLITRSPFRYTLVRPECPDRAVLFTNHNVTACQSTRGR